MFVVGVAVVIRRRRGVKDGWDLSPPSDGYKVPPLTTTTIAFVGAQYESLFIENNMKTTKKMVLVVKVAKPAADLAPPPAWNTWLFQ